MTGSLLRRSARTVPHHRMVTAEWPSPPGSSIAFAYSKPAFHPTDEVGQNGESFSKRGYSREGSGSLASNILVPAGTFRLHFCNGFCRLTHYRDSPPFLRIHYIFGKKGGFFLIGEIAVMLS